MGLLDKLVKEGKKVVNGMVPEDNKETGGGAGTSFADDSPDSADEASGSAFIKNSQNKSSKGE